MKANQEIKTRAKQSGVYLWEVAERLDMTDGNFSRKLRRELPAAEKAQIMALIDEIAAEKKNAGQRAATR